MWQSKERGGTEPRRKVMLTKRRNLAGSFVLLRIPAVFTTTKKKKVERVQKILFDLKKNK